ncbi:DUF4331 domain-containing protein [Frateuria sp.]|uniref:DUF4331 domain-containing protein n=1 Tax=Frateuria sp. TaxID=2211372 RepID=UPI0025BE7471|nr:DUF4331 domain-containing protein [Frateuria sp.]
MKLKPLCLYLGLGLILPAAAMASSHREAPFISTMPQVDASDFYMFMSYEPQRAGYVTLLANYNPLQDPTGGPNFFPLSDNAVYDINVDNSGDGRPDLTFRFRFKHTYKNLKVLGGSGHYTPVPLLNIGPVSATDQSKLNRIDTYTVEVRKGNGNFEPLESTNGSKTMLTQPVDNIGTKSIANYANYADSYVYNVAVPGCSRPGRVFVGQRKDGFVVNVGEIFDLVNLNPLGPRDGARNALTHKNVTTLALEMPASCLQQSASNHIIGGWTTASIPSKTSVAAYGQGEKAAPDASWVQVSRLGMPLVNELVIGLKDKDRFNNSIPCNDAQFLSYVTTPSLPVILNALYKTAIPHTPRNDLVTVFLTGVPGLNKPAKVSPSEELRLNTSIAPTAPIKQNDLGVLGGDMAGFPNGRRPYDDVADIELRVAEGALCGVAGNCGNQMADPNKGAPFTDGARAAGASMATEHVTGDENAADTYLERFPYLMPPLPGAPNGSNGVAAN